MIGMSGRRLVWVCCALVACAVSYGEERTESDVVVSAESDDSGHDQFTEPGEYAQPAWAERNRLSSTTSVYVLSPYEVFGGILWEGDFRRQGKSVHDLIQG